MKVWIRTDVKSGYEEVVSRRSLVAKMHKDYGWPKDFCLREIERVESALISEFIFPQVEYRYKEWDI